MPCSYEGCRHPVWDADEAGNQWCVFHHPDSGRKHDAFRDAWAEYLSTRADGENRYAGLNCRGFIFPIIIRFREIVFTEDVCCADAVFFVLADFHGSTFTQGADFKSAHFNVGSFASATFSEETDFSGAHFDGRAVFARTNFSYIYFRGAWFRRAVFLASAFTADTDFRDAFFADASFSKALFTADADFRDAQFTGKAYFRGASFNYGRFDSSSFIGADLSGSTFANCSFRDVNYNLKPTWVHKNETLPLSSKTRFSFQRVPPTNVTGIETFGILAASNRAFVRDIEDQQFIQQVHHHAPVWYWFWRISCDCGRGFWRFLFWCFIIAVGFGILYQKMGAEWFGGSVNESWITPFYYSIVTFSTLGFGDISPTLSNPAAQAAVMVEVFLGYLGLGGLLSILANKLARRAG